MSFEFLFGVVIVGGFWYMLERNRKWNDARRDHVRRMDQKWKDYDAGKGPEPTSEEVRLYHEIMQSRGGVPFRDQD